MSDTSASNVALMKKLGAAFNDKNLDEIMSYFADDAIYESYEGGAPSGDVYRGKAAIRSIFAAQFSAIPDRRFESLLPIAQGDHGAMEYAIVIPGTPELRAMLCDFFEFAQGKVRRKSTWLKLIKEPTAS